MGPNDILVLLARPSELVKSKVELLAVSGPDDHAHVARFRAQRDRDQALASRAIQRFALSLATNDTVPPARWRFVNEEAGRPVVEFPREWCGLKFSVANTHGLVGCAVGTKRFVGLDIEPLRSDVPSELLERCLSASEREALVSLPANCRPRRFLRLWTVKEAYLKARGLGIVEPLSQISVDFAGATQPTLAIAPALNDVTDGWHLHSWYPTEEHLAALCIERRNDQCEVSQRWVC